MDQWKPAKVLVTGSVNGSLGGFFEKIKKLDAKYGPFSVLLITGNLFSDEPEADEIDALLKNELSVPIMTYAISGDRALPQRVLERINIRSGEVCNNLVFLKGHGILQTSEGIKVAYIGGRHESQIPANSSATATATNDSAEADGDSGAETKDKDQKAEPPAESDGETAKDPPQPDLTACTFSNNDIIDLVSQVAAENEKTFQKTLAQPSVDVLVTFDWPYGVVSTDTSQTDLPKAEAQTASNKISYLCGSIMPRYHFAAGEEVFYERLPWKYNDRIRVGHGSSATGHFTRFIGLGAVNGASSSKGKQRWFYAMNVTPLQLASQGKAPPSETPHNCTANPLHRFSRSRTTLDSKSLDRALENMNSDSKPDGGKGNSASFQGRRPPPPLSYVCRNCSQPGHWIQDCPAEAQQKRQRTKESPPAGYVCHKCRNPGHWRADCTASGDGDQAADLSSKCWFCLANPDVDQNLMAAIGDEAYVAMAKGALVAGGSTTDGYQGQSSPIPGGGHVLIVPIAHTHSLRGALTGDDKDSEGLGKEIGHWENAITDLFAEYDCVPLAFETCRNVPHVHTMIQMVPIPRAKASAVKSTLMQICQEDGLQVEHDYPKSLADGYFRVKDPAGGKTLYIAIPAKLRKFNLQLGRRLAARILGIPEREDWKVCVVPEQEEARGRDKFIAAFAKHDFTR